MTAWSYTVPPGSFSRLLPDPKVMAAITARTVHHCPGCTCRKDDDG